MIFNTRNRPERITSLIKQIIPFQSNEIEIVISDNASDVDISKIVQKFNDSRIQYYRNKKNLGYDMNVIKVVERAKGEFIFLTMDDDDIEIESIPLILETIKSKKNISQICGHIGDKREGHPEIYFRYSYKNKILSKGVLSLIRMLFYYPHGSGIVLRKKYWILKKQEIILDFYTCNKL